MRANSIKISRVSETGSRGVISEEFDERCAYRVRSQHMDTGLQRDNKTKHRDYTVRIVYRPTHLL
jgi:hypothetical protein